MKHKIQITIILLTMFLLTQFIGLYVIDSYSGEDLPYGLETPQTQDQNYGPNFLSLLMAFVVAIFLMFIFTKTKAKFILRLWFFIVIMIALGISFTAILQNIDSSISLKVVSLVALLFALPLALSKMFSRNPISHNLSELFIYPGIAVIFIPLLNVVFLIALLILISIYDMWAVWKSGIMQKMAKFQIDHLKVFSGFFIPYLTKKQRQQLKKLRKTDKAKLEKRGIKVNVAILGGGDVIFPLIAAGVMLSVFGIWSALLVILGAVISLGLLFMFSEKKKFYPAMPFISTGILLAIGISYLIF